MMELGNNISVSHYPTPLRHRTVGQGQKYDTSIGTSAGQTSIKALALAKKNRDKHWDNSGTGIKNPVPQIGSRGTENETVPDRIRQVFDGVPMPGNDNFPEANPTTIERLAGTAKQDKRGFGVPSNSLPLHLRPIGYAGWKLELTKDGRAVLVSDRRGADEPWDCMTWLASNYEFCKAALLEWQQGVGEA